ncbi:aquaporin-like protein [Aspergillus karnatakaensis]|uniref:putative aquaglyceroporin n=1 Tax=Aspergillus karnatakaensis TaxID=1810916 RepID=UPI003CCD5B97
MARGDSYSTNNSNVRSHTSNTSSGATTIKQDDLPNDAQPAMISLAGTGSRAPPNQNVVYLHPDYLRYNPQYGEQHKDGPVWSLAQPLPHVVRNGMRSGSDGSSDKKEGDTHHQEQTDRPNANTGREPASAEPPAANPPGNEQQQGKLEAQNATPESRDYFNIWGKWRDVVRRELAEWLGITLAMTLGLCAGLSTYTSQNQAGTFPSLAAAWGFAFMLAIYVAGGVSGGHLNPAITISLSVWRGFPAKRCTTYVAAQILGAITASGIAYAIYHDAIIQLTVTSAVPQNQSTAKQAMLTLPKEFIAPASAFFTEFIGSAVLIGVIMALGDDTNAPPGAGMQAFIIGLLITVLVLALGYTTGGCFNPARDFGARLVCLMAGWGGDLFTEYHAWWIWGPWVADVTGGLFGGFLYDLIIFTGGESPINYPARRRKRALLLKERNIRSKAGLGRDKIPDLERAAQEFE